MKINHYLLGFQKKSFTEKDVLIIELSLNYLGEKCFPCSVELGILKTLKAE